MDSDEKLRAEVTQAQDFYDWCTDEDHAFKVAGVYFQVKLPWEVSQEDADLIYDHLTDFFESVGEDLFNSLSILLPNAILTSSGIARSQDSPH